MIECSTQIKIIFFLRYIKGVILKGDYYSIGERIKNGRENFQSKKCP